jgi:hypothetical protein
MEYIDNIEKIKSIVINMDITVKPIAIDLELSESTSGIRLPKVPIAKDIKASENETTPIESRTPLTTALAVAPTAKCVLKFAMILLYFIYLKYKKYDYNPHNIKIIIIL